MISGALTVDDMRLVVGIGDVFGERQGMPLGLNQLKEALSSRGLPIRGSMTRRIDDLEHKLGGHNGIRRTLLNRRRSGSYPTVDLPNICRPIRQMLEKLDALPVHSGRSVLRIGMTNFLATNFFPRLLLETDFRQVFPKVELEFVEGEPHELVGLLQSQVEFAVGPRDPTNTIRSTALCRWKRVMLYNRHVSYRHDFSQKVGLETLAEWLRDETVIVPTNLVIPGLEKFLRPVRLGGRITLAQATGRRSWVEKGIGVAITYEEKRGSCSAGEPLRSIDLSEKLGTTEMHLYQQSDREISSAAQYMIRMIRNLFCEREYEGADVPNDVIPIRSCFGG
ncbi:MAG: substrate-binding domain-containing protein [Planctomycetaceae bacterium]